MGVFPVEDFQGARDNVEFMGDMLHGGFFLSPDFITSCVWASKEKVEAASVEGIKAQF